jgi:hypothetical protein
MDLFLRMLQAGYEFILTSKSLVWHFGARGSHRLEENNGQTSNVKGKQKQKTNKNGWLSGEGFLYLMNTE